MHASINKHANRNLLLGFGISLLLLIFSSIAAVVSIRQLIGASNLVDHTYQVINKLEQTSGVLLNAETAQRGFLLTNDELFLEPYNDARSKIDNMLSELSNLTTDNAYQQNNLTELSSLAKERLHQLEVVIAMRRTETEVSYGDFRNGRETMINIRPTRK